MNRVNEADITCSQLSRESSSRESHSSVASEDSRPLELRRRCRADAGKVHRVRHGILSRDVLVALVRMGDDRRMLRRLERKYHKAIHPIGPFGDLFFDRFWSSYLRLILIGRLEVHLFAASPAQERQSASAELMLGPLPTLVSQDPEVEPVEGISLNEALPPDLLRRLVLMQRYDRHFAREMYRSLALLLLLRHNGEAALESWASEMLRTQQPRRED